ncbi:microcystin dependent MdpB family protein [Haloferula helveola]|uniref:Microcystin dependent MdpB family protein n=1 Tax=Haloferula helveola TaxID=490095 RepID=A0ABN6H7U9_9BACT|nr:microcystin dependent MdpB family protein [Haloferula helveola]
MSEPYVGEIKMFAGNFAPRGYALCDGQLLSISQNDALFSLLGTIYGGDGRTTFGLPDLRGRLPVHYGSGPGLTNRNIGSKGGAQSVTLTVNQLPSHTHGGAVHCPDNAETTVPVGAVPARPGHDLYIDDAPDTSLNSAAVTNTGGSQSHDNLMPSLCVNFIIALVGIYPSRT